MSGPGWALTVHEVRRYTREAVGALYGIPWPVDASPQCRRKVEQALAALNELEHLAELVLAVDAGLGVIVDPDDAGVL